MGCWKGSVRFGILRKELEGGICRRKVVDWIEVLEKSGSMIIKYARKIKQQCYFANSIHE